MRGRERGGVLETSDGLRGRAGIVERFAIDHASPSSSEPPETQPTIAGQIGPS
jgi:hypothetical protein